MRRERSIRFRLTVWYALVLLASLGVFGLLIQLSMRARLMGEMDEDLTQRAASFESYVRREAAEVPFASLKVEMEEFCQALPPSSFLELRGVHGFEFHYPGSAGIQPGRARIQERSFRVRGEDYSLRIGASLRAVEHTLDLLQILLLSIMPLVIAIACVGGAWLSRRALKPVDEITAAARAIGIDNLSLRLPTPRTGDELQRLTEVWNGMLARLEEAVRTLSQFAADASHELRTPLAVIRTTAEIALRRARAPEAYRESLLEIGQEAERMTQLVEDLLFLARNDAQAAEMPKEPLELGAIVREAATQLEPLAAQRDLRLRIRVADGVSLVGNRAALRRLLLVLLDNAIKYSRPGSEIIATAREDGALVVEDFGAGIAEADLPHIFKRFYQADQARTDGGFGLGLSLAESIARAHGAVIDVKSVEGAGSTFTVRFAVAVSPALAWQ